MNSSTTIAPPPSPPTAASNGFGSMAGWSAPLPPPPGARFVANCLKQRQRADHIGLHERGRAIDGPVHMAFGGEVDHCLGLILSQQFRDQGAVADVAMHEHMARVGVDGCQRVAIACVGQQVEVDDADIATRHCFQDEITANEACATCDQPCFH